MEHKEKPYDKAAEAVKSDIEQIPYRHPVVEYPDYLENHLQADRQWFYLTEVLKRDILLNPELKAIAKNLATRALNEKLPLEAVEQLSEKDDRTRRFSQFYSNKELGYILGLEAIPESAADGNIMEAPDIIERPNPHEIHRLIKQKLKDPAKYEELIDEKRTAVETAAGLSFAEARITTQRYRYGRDIKIIGLMACLIDEPFPAEAVTNKDGLLVHNLNNGIKLAVEPEALTASRCLVEPASWQRRQQIKDRVYEVVAGGKSFIMKEQKTSRHINTLAGHLSGMSSAEEYAVASELSKKSSRTIGGVRFRFEKPLGYVEFPDGYQFCMFEKDKLYKCAEAVEILTEKILNFPERYEEDYLKIRARANQIYQDWKNPTDVQRSHGLKAIFSRSKIQASAGEARPLSYSEYATCKANHQANLAMDMFYLAVFGRGYIDQDGNTDFLFSLPADPAIDLEIIGIDCEFFKKDSEKASRSLGELKMRLDSSIYLEDSKISEQDKMNQAATVALMETSSIDFSI